MEEVWNIQFSYLSCPSGQLSNQWRKGLVRAVTKKLIVVERHDRVWQYNKHHCNTPPVWAYWQSGQTLLSKDA